MVGENSLIKHNTLKVKADHKLYCPAFMNTEEITIYVQYNF